MKTRAITGFIFVIVMLASVLSGLYAFTAFLLILSTFTLEEFYRLLKHADIEPNKIFGFAIAVTLFLVVSLFFINGADLIYLLSVIPLMFLVVVSELYRKKTMPFHNIAYTLFGILFVALPFCLFYALAFTGGQYNFVYPLAFLILLWASDTGAYLFGISFGKNKLFERHSPKKTWEGLAGGLLTSLIAAGIISIYFKELDLFHWMALSTIIVIAGSFGDLAESMLKRNLSVKDSGSLLPGHGGLLDRFDGLLLAAPLVFVYLQFIRLF